ncbi:MAG: TonB family protein, partial [Deltaproteobacteria bacterium]|nr:TonB family protein [Deltaproteobacteria bacterium]
LMEQGETLNRGNIISLGLNYQLMTPYTSFLVLESYEAEEALNSMNKGKSFNWDNLKNSGGKEKVGEKRDDNLSDDFKAHLQQLGYADEKDNPNPHMARSEAKEISKNSGILSYLSSGNAPTSPYGRDVASGNDPENAYGQVQDSPLKGLSLGVDDSYNHYGIKGAGRGGGGTGEGTVGLGDLNTIGHGGGGGSGSGYGTGAGGLGGRRGSAPRIRSGAAIVTGDISKEVVRRIVHRHINEVKFCYESAASQKELPDGRIAVKFIISQSGSVQMAAIESSTMGNTELESCVAQAVRRWTFPSIKSGKVAIVTYPFQFTGEESNGASNNTTADKASKKLPASEQCPEEKKMVAKPAIVFTKSFCSDTSSRPLYEKNYIWKNRLERAGDISSKIDLFFKAGSNCELKGWKEQTAFLDLIEAASADENDVNNLMSRFSAYPVIKKYLRRRILQKTINPAVAGKLMMDESVEWDNLARDLAVVENPDKRIEMIRKILINYPGNPVALNLLAVELYKNGEYEESELIALNLRKSEAASPDVIKALCEITAREGSQKSAKRVCSEIVEFNSVDKGLRLSLGNLFMRFGWFEDAYNQFKIIASGDDYNPLAILRMAQAASGMGKDDEALRLAYKVAGENETGNEKYQLWAQLFIGSRLALMINSKETPDGEKELLQRKLKRTKLFSSSNSVEFLIWEDSDAELNFEFTDKDKMQKTFSSEMLDAKEVGLFMATVKTDNNGESGMIVKNVGNPVNRTVGFTLLKVSYDGKKFKIETENKKLEPKPKV